MTAKRVVKLGGSLLSWPDWPRAFHEWHRQSSSRDIIVVGGGSRVDQLRELDHELGIGQIPCHAIAIRMMAANAYRVARELGVKIVSDLHPNNDRNQPCVLDIDILNARQPLTDHRGQRLPKHWNVTSDSLAAAVAHQWNADELVLLKSTTPPPRHDWSDSGFVDPLFASYVSPTLHVTAVNLRNCCPALSTQNVTSAHSTS